LLLLTLFLGTASAISDLESRRIDYLIAAVEQLRGAKFVRNGKEYDGKQAAEHLRLKRKNTESRVQSAEDFIRVCATKSYLSGKPYLIRFSDGRQVPSSEFFQKLLSEYRPVDSNRR